MSIGLGGRDDWVQLVKVTRGSGLDGSVKLASYIELGGRDGWSAASFGFYPLAGRIQGNLLINCNDEGVEFNEADVLTSLAEILANPDPEELTRLLPFPPLSTNKSVVTAVQVNHFSCGGMAISMCILHKFADAATTVAFINAWAHNARWVSDNNDTESVIFDSASFFPSTDLNEMYDPEGAICKEKTVTRRLIFNKENLDELKKQCDEER
ncbi:limonoid 21-O-acetyltransferse-like [Silene latifolia]|uniref:limonoid 21-O-acetyltransferse-like n=1 Tax=Silene latifolia TaxID=37657 RepID=UPI003D7756EE